MQCWPEQVLAIVCATLRSLLFGDYRYCVLPADTCCYLLLPADTYCTALRKT